MSTEYGPTWVDTMLAWMLLVAAIVLVAIMFLIPEAAAQGMDLPMKPARYGERPNLPKPDRRAEDDPRDTPPPTIYGEEIVSQQGTVVFVLDRSGSMGQGSRGGPNRLERAKAEVARCLNELPLGWEFGICTYSSHMRHFSTQLVEVNEASRAEALAWLASQNYGGSTYTGPAMVDCFARYDSDYFVLITDGAPNYGPEVTRQQIRDGNVNGATIDVFGIEAIGRFRAFCQGVASDSGGSYTDVQ